MNKYLERLINKYGPKENTGMMEGMAYWQDVNNKIVEYLDIILQSLGQNTPEGLEYICLEEVTPEEYVKYVAKNVHEITKSDLRILRVKFSYDGEEIVKFVSIPYVNRGGIIRFNGTRYYIMPVITDYIISLVRNNVFVRLNKDKINITRYEHPIKLNGYIKTGTILSPRINYSKQDNIGRGISAIPILTHYLLCKYGYTDMCQKYLGFVPEVTRDNIDYHKDYVVVESANIRKHKTTTNDIKFILPKDKVTPIAMNVMFEMVYLLDHFAYLLGTDKLDNTDIWKITLGYIYYSPESPPNMLIHDIDDHLNMVETYIDPIVISKLRDRGYIIDSIYDLMAVILGNIQDWTKHYKEINESVYYRYLDVLYYIMYDIMEAINTAANNINYRYKKKGILTYTDIEKILNRFITIRKPYKLVNSKQSNISIMGIEYCGDNYYPKITAMLTLQECGDGVKKKRKHHTVPERVKTINGTEILVGSLFYLNKKLPTPLIRMNPFCRVNPDTGKIEPEPEYKEVIDKLHRLLSIRADESKFIGEIEIDDLENELEDF